MSKSIDYEKVARALFKTFCDQIEQQDDDLILEIEDIFNIVCCFSGQALSSIILASDSANDVTTSEEQLDEIIQEYMKYVKISTNALKATVLDEQKT